MYEGYECVGAATGQEAVAVVEKDPPDLVFLDIKMPGMDGIEVLKLLKAIDDSLPIVMISGHATVSTAVEATRLGAPISSRSRSTSERVLVTVKNALDKAR